MEIQNLHNVLGLHTRLQFVSHEHSLHCVMLELQKPSLEGSLFVFYSQNCIVGLKGLTRHMHVFYSPLHQLVTVCGYCHLHPNSNCSWSCCGWHVQMSFVRSFISTCLMVTCWISALMLQNINFGTWKSFRLTLGCKRCHRTHICTQSWRRIGMCVLPIDIRLHMNLLLWQAGL